MAPFDWLTSRRVSAVLDVFAVALFLGLGAVSLYLGVTQPSGDVIFGANEDVVLGLAWLAAGIAGAVLFLHGD